MNVLEMTLNLPLIYVYPFVVVILLMLHWIWRWKTNLNKYFPENKIFQHAREKYIAIMQKWFTNGFFVFESLEKDKKGDLYTRIPENSNTGIRFDPRMQSRSSRSNTLKGLEIYQYASNSPFNLTASNAMAFQLIINHIRKNYPTLNFLPSEVLIEFCAKERNVMLNDCASIVSIFNTQISFDMKADKVAAIKESMKEDLMASGTLLDENRIEYQVEEDFQRYIKKMKAEKLSQTFIKIQDELVSMKMESGYFSFADAFLNISSCITAVDLQTLKNMIDKMSMLTRERYNLDFLVSVGIFIVLSLVGVIILYAGMPSGG